MSNYEIFLLWVAGFPALGIVLGVAGLKVRAVRYVLAGLAPGYSLLLFVYALFRGGPNECVTSAGPPGYTCHPTSFMSGIGWFGVLVVVVVTVVSLSPLASARAHRRAPAVLGAIVLVALIAAFVFGLFWWVPAGSAVLAAAIAGPPNRAPRAAPVPAPPAGDPAT